MGGFCRHSWNCLSASLCAFFSNCFCNISMPFFTHPSTCLFSNAKCSNKILLNSTQKLLQSTLLKESRIQVPKMLLDRKNPGCSDQTYEHQAQVMERPPQKTSVCHILHSLQQQLAL